MTNDETQQKYSGVRIIPHTQESQDVFSGVNLPVPTANTLPVRDNKGRFLTGNTGGGRRKGSRNKLSEMFLNTIVEDFAEHGAATLERLRNEDPGLYLKMIAVLVPKSLIREYETKHDYTNLSEEEVIELLEEARRKHIVEKMLEAVQK